MGTDIYGGIEYRHPDAAEDWFEWEAWLPAMDLRPLYDEQDYAAFGFLFGGRDFAGLEPVAAGRGLPPGICARLREELEPGLEAGHLGRASWLSWAELARLPEPVSAHGLVGRVAWTAASQPFLTHRRFVPPEWPDDLAEKIGPPPPQWHPAADWIEWKAEQPASAAGGPGPGELTCLYRALSLDLLIGPATQWPHVFAVMRALAGRFGEEGVRLVVAFD